LQDRARGRSARRIAHYGVLLVALAAPLLIGGALPWAQVALSFAMMLVTAAWIVSRGGEVKMPPFGGLAALAVGFTILQLIPMPAGVVGALSPRALEVHQSVVGGRPGFVPLTLDTPATVLAALRGFACLGVLLVTASATRWRGRTALFVVPLVFGGGAIAMLSFGQRWLGATTILGIYQVADLPGSGFFGTFVNGNHAASLFTLTAILAIGCMRETDGPVKLGAGICAAVCLFAVLSTHSRAGLLSAAVGLFAMAVLWLLRRFGTRTAMTASGGLALVMAPLALLMAVGLKGLMEGGGTFSGTRTAQKVRGWGDGLSMARDFPWTGVGRGAFEAPATFYRTSTEGVRLVFPENLLVQMLSEWGIPLAIALLTLFLLTALPIARRVSRWEPLYQAAACGVLAVLVHELADFGLEMPGVALPTAMALGLVAGRAQVSANQNEKTPMRLRWPVAGVALGAWSVLLFYGLWAVPRTADADAERAAQLVKTRAPDAAAELARMIRRHPSDYYFELQSVRQAMMTGSDDVLRHVNRALQLYPQSPHPHLLAAHYLARVGRRSQAAIEYRLAVERGHAFNHAEAVQVAGPRDVERAVPQRPEELLKLASVLVAEGRVREAETISNRAVGLATDQKPLHGRLDLALSSGDKAFIRRAAAALGGVATDARGLELAAEGMARSEDLPAAQAILKRSMQQFPNDGLLMVRAARLLFTHGDMEGALALLRERGRSTFSIPDRIALEQLMAEMADKQGTPEVAAAARTRARLLQRVSENHDSK
jgi:O-antigen ligase